MPSSYYLLHCIYILSLLNIRLLSFPSLCDYIYRIIAFPVWKLFDSSLSYLLQASAILDDFNGASEVLDSDQHHLYVEHVAILHYYELILKHESLSTSIAMSKAFLLSSKSVNWRPSETPSCIASLSSRKKSILESLMIMTSHNQVKIWCVSFKETRIWKFLVWALFSRELKAGMKYSFPRKHFHLPMEYPQESYLFDLIPPARLVLKCQFFFFLPSSPFLSRF